MLTQVEPPPRGSSLWPFNSYGNGSGWDWACGDFNGDTFVDDDDIWMIIRHGQYAGETGTKVLMQIFGVPEPGTVALLAIGTAALLRRRRK